MPTIDVDGISQIKTANNLVYSHVKLDDNRTVSLFVNLKTNLVVLDIVDADNNGGNEIYRGNV